MFEYIFFDLDGTLTDPGIGITNSVMYALKRYGIEVADRSVLYPFIGPPLDESFRQYYGFGKEQSIEAVKIYREYFSEYGLFENEVYGGVREMLEKLSEMGKRLILATSKPEVFARRILEHFGLDGYFYFIAGATLDGSRIRKADVITYAMEKCGITDTAACLMVGDREHDVLGAAAVGLSSVGVTYGYGSREELENAGADFIAESPADICDIIADGRRTHIMKLDAEPFEKIAAGTKTVEMRLYDEKRRRIRPGDVIVFRMRGDEDKTVCAEVTALRIYAGFRELYAAFPPEALGYDSAQAAGASPDDMLKYYPAGLQKKYPAAAIEIRLCHGSSI